MTYEELMEKLSSANFVPPYQYYSSIAEQLILEGRTVEERARLKDAMLRFVLKWYKDLSTPMAPERTDFIAIRDFIRSAKTAGYDYEAEWAAVLKSIGPLEPV